jgi:CRISPR-associated protein Cst1
MGSEQSVSRQSQIKTKDLLTFTGNWFIDAGILGFVNLMEEVYEWDLNKIVSRPVEKEIFYYAYFIYYIRKTAIDWISRQSLKKNVEKNEFEKAKDDLRKRVERITKTKFDGNDIKKQIIEINKRIKEEINKSFGEYENDLKKDFSGNKKTILGKIDQIGIIIQEPFFHNLNFLNPSKNRKGKETKVLEAFEEMIFRNKIKAKQTENALDKTISKYLFSEEEFTNLPYCKIQTLNDLDKLISCPSIIFLLSFPIAFNRIFDRYIFFYTNNLESCYYINKNIKVRIERMKNGERNRIIEVTWQSIIDYMTEQKSIFSLENMYLIEHEGIEIEQQNLINVEYIGIPKLQAAILLDDTIRENLNKIIQFRSENSKEDKYRWLVEEFIKGRPIYPIIMNHVNLVLNDEIDLKDFNACFYSLVVEAKILEFRAEKGRGIYLFSKNYFDNYKHLVDEIKREIRVTSFKASLINQLSEESETNKRIARELFDALKGKNKNMFLNILIKNLNENKKLCSNKNLNDWIFEKIIKNDETFEMYGLILIMNLLKKY